MRTLQRIAGGYGPARSSWEKQQRLRLLADIAVALHTLYGDHHVAGWLRRPNGRPPFDGRTPLAFMLGGDQALHAVHQLLTADLSGLFRVTPEAHALAAALPQPDFDLDSPSRISHEDESTKLD
nr:antitoxin Xre/MbcA/ParS toxin-binding domain-containing protein [Deinococcus arcticus]